MASLTIENLRKNYGSVEVLKGIDIEIDDGGFLVLVGPSGCGKSTLLNTIAGLEEITSGDIKIGPKSVAGLHPSKRDIAMVFQSYALYPNMTVAQNISFGMEIRGIDKSEREAAIQKVADMLQIGELLHRKPSQLSGGQRQRVAIGRSIVRDLTAFLFDEPLSNLDAALRVEMRYEIAKLHQTLKSTMIYVTHDQVEAMTLADRIVVLEFGKIAQVGSPRELYERPANLFVAQFIGSPRMNVITASAAPNVEVPSNAVSFGTRPEHIELSDAGVGQIQGTVDVWESLGADTFLIMSCGDAGQITVRVTGTAT